MTLHDRELVRREYASEERLAARTDASERMVELTRACGVEARVGDVQSLAFADGEFDCVVANWVLFHAADVDLALREIARVLRAGGRLVAVTNGDDHLAELYELVGVPKQRSAFSGENAGARLSRHFATVERRDATGWIAFPERTAAQAYVDAARSFAGEREPPDFAGPLRVRRSPSLFVAET